MEVGITMAIKNSNGSLALSVSQCGCYVKDLVISLDGGASWFYQGYVFPLHLCRVLMNSCTASCQNMST